MATGSRGSVFSWVGVEGGPRVCAWGVCSQGGVGPPAQPRAPSVGLSSASLMVAWAGGRACGGPAWAVAAGPGVGCGGLGQCGASWEWIGHCSWALTCTPLLLLVFVQLDSSCSMSGPQPAAAPKLGSDKQAGGPAEVCVRVLGTVVCRPSPGLWQHASVYSSGVGGGWAPPQEYDVHITEGPASLDSGAPQPALGAQGLRPGQSRLCWVRPCQGLLLPPPSSCRRC